VPTYPYECQECGHQFERFQKMTDEPLKTCPRCGERVRRLIGGGAGVIFKGSGSHGGDRGNLSESASRCGRDRPCCGADAPCDSPPCEDGGSEWQ